jgi:hypothetical protein
VTKITPGRPDAKKSRLATGWEGRTLGAWAKLIAVLPLHDATVELQFSENDRRGSCVDILLGKELMLI